MEFDREFVIYLLSATVVGLGLWGFIKGELTYGPESGSSEGYRTLSGGKARLVSALLAASGLVLLFSTTAGLCMFGGVVLLPWLIRD